MSSFVEEYGLIILAIVTILALVGLLVVAECSYLNVEQDINTFSSQEVTVKQHNSEGTTLSSDDTQSSTEVETILHENNDEDLVTGTVENKFDSYLISIGTPIFATITVVFICVLVYRIVESIVYNFRSGNIVFRNPYKRITKFCDDNGIVLSTDLMVKMANASKFSSVYGKLICDFVRCKSLDNLIHGDYVSSNWVVYFFYLTRSNFVVLSDNELHSMSLNYLKDVIKYYDKLSNQYGVVNALDALNRNMMLNLSVNDIDNFKNCVNNSNFIVDKNCRMDLILSDDAILESKYQKWGS